MITYAGCNSREHAGLNCIYPHIEIGYLGLNVSVCLSKVGYLEMAKTLFKQ